jgi:hypothetical protein
MGYAGLMFGDLQEALTEYRIANLEAGKHDYLKEQHLDGNKPDEIIVREYDGEIYDLKHGRVGGF